MAKFYRDPSSFKFREITELFGDSEGTFSITHIYQCTPKGRDTKIQAPPKNKQKNIRGLNLLHPNTKCLHSVYK